MRSKRKIWIYQRFHLKERMLDLAESKYPPQVMVRGYRQIYKFNVNAIDSTRIGNGSKLWPICWCRAHRVRRRRATSAKNLSTTEKATHAVLLLQSGSLVSERRSCCCKGANVIAAESCGVTKLRWVWRHSVHRCADHLKISSLANIASFSQVPEKSLPVHL